MVKEPVNIGVVCLARKTFDHESAAIIYQGFQEKMGRMDDTNFVFIPHLIIEPEDASAAINALSGKNLDALICISGTFHLGHLILDINTSLKIPIMLWAPDELPYDGGKIRLNSVCGLNLNASNLYKGRNAFPRGSFTGKFPGRLCAFMALWRCAVQSTRSEMQDDPRLLSYGRERRYG